VEATRVCAANRLSAMRWGCRSAALARQRAKEYSGRAVPRARHPARQGQGARPLDAASVVPHACVARPGRAVGLTILSCPPLLTYS